MGLLRSSGYLTVIMVFTLVAMPVVASTAPRHLVPIATITQLEVSKPFVLMIGKSFTPVEWTTGQMTATGENFTPVEWTTGEITATGKNFTPVEWTTGRMTATGKTNN